MSDRVERPLFYDGQYLGADDLQAGLDYVRGHNGRHDRYLHSWGIAEGLVLTLVPKQSQDGAQLVLQKGLAIDGTGREVTVLKDTVLSERDFEASPALLSREADPWFPVFLVGREDKVSPPGLLAGACANGQPRRLAEGFDVVFDGPGAEKDLDGQPTGDVAEGPGQRRWLILLGFVRWDRGKHQFKDVSPEAGGVRRRYAGVRADAVTARDGLLSLRVRPPGAFGKPLVVVDERADGGELAFGLDDGKGGVQKVLQVNAKGDVTAKGKLRGALATGGVQVESGTATDGMTLPLPPGIREDQVKAGDAVVHTHVSLRLPPDADAPGPPDQYGAFPLELWVDDQRRVRCRVRWLRLGTAAFEDRPGVCDYVVLATVRAQ
jgi:hypothetical protein